VAPSKRPELPCEGCGKIVSLRIKLADGKRICCHCAATAVKTDPGKLAEPPATT
jgi:hypothetical protein